MGDDIEYGAAYTTPDDWRESTVGDPDAWVPNHTDWPAGWIPAKVEPSDLGHPVTAPSFYHRGVSYDSEFEERHRDEEVERGSLL